MDHLWHDDAIYSCNRSNKGLRSGFWINPSFLRQTMKRQYLVTVTVDVPSYMKENEKAILRKVCAAMERATGYITWQVECKKIKEDN